MCDCNCVSAQLTSQWHFLLKVCIEDSKYFVWGSCITNLSEFSISTRIDILKSLWFKLNLRKLRSEWRNINLKVSQFYISRTENLILKRWLSIVVLTISEISWVDVLISPNTCICVGCLVVLFYNIFFPTISLNFTFKIRPWGMHSKWVITHWIKNI